ncbi:MAG: hypothetical protein H0V89_09645 [Deltaproteobacteria bacterium]|nr:hypothetical protein [Deltaproteobacteria bacterium]
MSAEARRGPEPGLAPDAVVKTLHQLRNTLNNVHLQLVLAERDLRGLETESAPPGLHRITAASKQLAAAVACIAELETKVVSELRPHSSSDHSASRR